VQSWPEPLQVTEPHLVSNTNSLQSHPDSTGFGDYTESGQVIPVSFQGAKGGYVHAMYLDDEALSPVAASFGASQKKLASPTVTVEKDTLLGRAQIWAGAGRCRQHGLQASRARSPYDLASLTTPNYVPRPITPRAPGARRQVRALFW